MDQTRAPLWEALVAYANKKTVPFHTPGHKLRSGVFPNIDKILGTSFWTLDPSDEVEDEVNNHCFKTLLQSAEDLAAELFNSRAAKFLINGTSGGIHGMLLGLAGKILVPRFSHQSVYGGLILSEAEPIYLPTKIDPEWNIPLPPSWEEIYDALRNYSKIKTVFLTYPTYFGTTTNIGEIMRLKSDFDFQLFVDEAHGGHFRFSSYLPQSAIDLGADLVVHSAHKTLGSLTQSSILHINNPESITKINTALNILQSTSPSLILLGVLDGVRSHLAISGETLVEQSLQLGKYARAQLESIDGVKIAPGTLVKDPTKILFNLSSLGLSGLEVETLLRKEYNIQIELSDYYNALALISIGDTEASVDSLILAIKDIARRFAGNKELPKGMISYFLEVPKRALSIRNAINYPTELIPLSKAIDRIAAGFWFYPPGVPLIVPGEVISESIVDYLNQTLSRGWEIRGLKQFQVTVIKD